MSIKLNLKQIRKALNEGRKFKLCYSDSTVPIKHDCTLIDLDIPTMQTVFGSLIDANSTLYGSINDIITPDKKELLMMLKMFDTALHLEKSGDVITSTLVLKRYTDPMDLLKDYYDLPIFICKSSKIKN